MNPSNKGKPRPKPDHKSKNVTAEKPTGIKTTANEVTKRIRQAADLICSGYRRSQITESMCKEYGVSWQMVSIYLSRARELLIEESGRPKQEHVAEVLGEYQQILRNTEAGHSDKLQALKGKREMLGLDAPKRTELSGVGGAAIVTRDETPAKPDMTVEEIREVRRLLGDKTYGNGQATSDTVGSEETR